MSATDNQLDFTSLSEIMYHFDKVPYQQFWEDINNWFERRADEKNIDLPILKFDGGSSVNIQDLVKKIYHQAELLTALAEANIATNDVRM